MEFKRFLINKLILFFMLSTLITIAVSLIGSAFDSSALLGYDSLLTPIKYAGLCILPTLVTWSRRELSAKELLVRKVLLTIAGSVVFIFVLVNLFLWLKNSAEAKQMNRDLAQFQMLHE